MEMKPIQRCISCVLCLFLLCALAGCARKYPVKMETMDALFQQIRQEHSSVKDIEIYSMAKAYYIAIVLKPYDSDEMFAVLEKIYDTVTKEPFQEEYLKDAEEVEGQPYFDQGYRPALEMSIYEEEWFWTRKIRAGFSTSYQVTAEKHFDSWEGYVGSGGRPISNEEIKVKFGEN